VNNNELGAMMNWLILRGLARQAKHWGEFPDQLSSGKGVSKVLTPDLPGFGRENHVRFPSKMSKAVEYLEERFQEEKAAHEGPWFIMGLSLGGMVALEWAHRYPKSFSGVVTINSSISVNNPFSRLQPTAVQKIAKWIIDREPYRRERGVLELTSNLKQDQHSIVDEWVRAEVEHKMELKDVINQFAASIQFKGPEKLTVPKLTLASMGDRMVSPMCSYKINSKYDGELHVHPEAGHDLPLDAPDWVIERLIDFQKKHGK